MEKRFHERQANLGLASVLETIGKYGFFGLIAISIIQLLCWGIFGG
jgi:hypothetical protein